MIKAKNLVHPGKFPRQGIFTSFYVLLVDPFQFKGVIEMFDLLSYPFGCDIKYIIAITGEF